MGKNSKRRREQKARKKPAASTRRSLSPLWLRMMAGDPHLRITYFIPHEPQNLEEASPFGMYTPGLHQSAQRLLCAAMLPCDVREFRADRRSVLHLRLRRAVWPQIMPIDVTALEELASQHELPSLFRLVLTADREMAERIDKLSFSDALPFLHVSSVPGINRIEPGQLRLQTMADFAEQVLSLIAKRDGMEKYVEASREAMGAGAFKSMGVVPFGSSCHNVTVPGECALLSFGYTIDGADPIVDSETDQPLTDRSRYIDHICRLADFISGERIKLTAGLPPDLNDWSYIVSVPSLHWSHYRNWQARGEELSGEDRVAFRAAYRAAVTQETYFNSIDEETTPRYIKNKIFRQIIKSRAADQRCYTAGLAMLASATMAPVLRLEPRINRVRGDLKTLSHSVRSGGHHNRVWKQSRLTRVLAERIRGCVDDRFLQRLDRWSDQSRTAGLKLVADMPLEWLSADGVPLGLRYDTSRVPVLPGNSFLYHCIAPPVVLPATAFRNILVIRSFEDDDPLKWVLQRAIDSVTKEREDACSVRFVDVSTEDEFISAVNSSESAVLIFDGHGGYEDRHGLGTIIVGGRPLDIWLLRDKCRVPPILIFSACDTHPIDGSHGSCAHAGLVLGARAVLGTLLPIDGRLATLFIGRLIFRILEFIPVALRDRPLLTWREVISGMLRMTYTSEVTQLLIRHAGVSLSIEASQRVQIAANNAINARRSNWYEIYLIELAKESGKTLEKLKGLVRLWASMTDSQKYVQLGAPENIVIESDVG